MTADKRTTHTDALDTLGTIITESEKRDAIHLAVEPVQAGGWLSPGDDVALIDGKAWKSGGKHVGIVDPFLKAPVKPGEWFWLVVYPRQITSLRHVWEHPDFPQTTEHTTSVTEREEAEQWLRDYAARIDEGFNTLLEAADSWLECGDYFYGARTGDYYGKFEGEMLHPDFWKYYQIYRSKIVPDDDQQSFFACSC